MVVENKGGAGGNIGATSVANADGDGQIILLTTTGIHSISPSLYKTLPFDHIKDFKPIAPVVDAPNVILVRNTLPVKTLDELVRYAKDKPGALNLAVPGNGTSPHLAAELLKSIAKIDLTNVTYRGGAPAFSDLVSGQVDLLVDAVTTATPHINAGTVRALAVTSKTRSPLLPTVPATAETIPGYEMNVWWGLMAPSKTPGSIVDRLNCENAVAVSRSS